MASLELALQCLPTLSSPNLQFIDRTVFECVIVCSHWIRAQIQSSLVSFDYLHFIVIEYYPGLISDDVIQAIRNLYVVDPLSIRYLESERQSIYAAKCAEELKDAICVLSAEYAQEPEDDTDDPLNRIEVLVVVELESIWEFQVRDPYDEEFLRVSRCYEYTFCDHPDLQSTDQWMLALVTDKRGPYGRDIIERLRKGRHSACWHNSIYCPKRNKRSLAKEVRITNKYGVRINISCSVLFPSPEEDKADWIEHDENGKVMVIPRQVSGIRKWNVKNRCYEAVDAHLIGAPTAEEVPKYWEEMLETFRKRHGAETVERWCNDEKLGKENGTETGNEGVVNDDDAYSDYDPDFDSDDDDDDDDDSCPTPPRKSKKTVTFSDQLVTRTMYY